MCMYVCMYVFYSILQILVYNFSLLFFPRRISAAQRRVVNQEDAVPQAPMDVEETQKFKQRKIVAAPYWALSSHRAAFPSGRNSV